MTKGTIKVKCGDFSSMITITENEGKAEVKTDFEPAFSLRENMNKERAFVANVTYNVLLLLKGESDV